MKKTTISNGQYVCLIILFVFGTSIAVNYGLKAKKDAWIAIMLGTLSGCGLFMLYSYLFRQFPNMTLIRYTREISGKWIGWLFGLLFVVYFIYDAARDVRDAGELLSAACYDKTPTLVLNAVMMLTVGYVLYKGIVVLARIGEIFIMLIMCIGVLGTSLIFFSNIIDIDNLLPVLEDGWFPIIRTTYPSTFIFPFGELLCVSMLFPYIKVKRNQLKHGIIAIVISGLLLSFTIAIDIAVLGADIAGRSIFAFLTMISIVDIADFLQRLDPFALFLLIIVDFFKIALLSYAAIAGAADLFKVSTYRTLIYPIGFIILLTSMLIAGSLQEHFIEGEKSITNFQLYVTIGIPVVLLLIYWLRRWFGRIRAAD